MYKYIKEPIKYGLRSHSFSWCVSDGVCCARRPGSGSARTLCGHGRSVSAQLLLPISQQAPQSHPHSSCAAADGGELAVCLPASLWRGSCEGAQAFCRHPGLTCQQNTTEIKFGWCRKFVSLGDGPVTHPIRENIVISCPWPSSATNAKGSSALRRAAPMDNHQSALASTPRCHIQSSLSVHWSAAMCSSFPWSPPPPPLLLTLSTGKGRSGWGEAICVVTESVQAEPSGESGRKLDNLVDMRPHWSQ